MKNKRLLIVSIAAGIVALCFLTLLQIGTADSSYLYDILTISDFLVLCSLSFIFSICVFILGYRSYDEKMEQTTLVITEDKSYKIRVFLSKLMTIVIVCVAVFYIGTNVHQTANLGNVAEIIEPSTIANDTSLVRQAGIPPIKVVGTISSDTQSRIIEDAIANQPSTLLKHTQLIYLCSHKEFMKLRDKMGADNAVAFATAYNNYIYIDATAYGLNRIITHELAHNFDFQNDYISLDETFEDKFKYMSTTDKFDSLSYIINVEYAKTNATEFFAEVSDAYFNERKQLRHLYPELYRYIDMIYKETSE